MWPALKKKDNIAINFDNNFWKEWGPTHMIYFNKELFNDNKDIKSIYCMYRSFDRIKLNPKEIAMALEYECGDFGEHTVLFSYEEIPNPNYCEGWNYYIFPNFDTENNEDISLYYNKLTCKDKDETYLRFLENQILNTFNLTPLEREKLRRSIGLNMEEYKKYLEKVEQLMISLTLEDYYKIKEQLQDFSSFKLIVSSLSKKITNIKNYDIKREFESTYSRIASSPIINDLNCIYHNTRELFLENVVQIESILVPEKEIDRITYKLVETGNMERIWKRVYGSVENQDGVAVFKKKMTRH